MFSSYKWVRDEKLATKRQFAEGESIQKVITGPIWAQITFSMALDSQQWQVEWGAEIGSDTRTIKYTNNDDTVPKLMMIIFFCVSNTHIFTTR